MAIYIGNHPEIGRKKCKRCGRMADEEAFFSGNKYKRSDRGGKVYFTTRSICIGCELSARNDPTPEARALRKARNSLQHHAEKYGMPAPAFAKTYGWEPERMAHDLLHALENTCVYCWFPYGEMGHGMSDITLDILDTKKPPYYHTNVQWCCQTCNSEKATLTPEIWARRLIEWREYRDWIAAVDEKPTFGLPLFEHPVLLGLSLAVITWLL